MKDAAVINNAGNALMKLVSALQVMGFDIEQVDIKRENMDDDIVVTLHIYAPAKVTITVTDFWRYPGVPCYFVNFSGGPRDFACCSGTPHIERALFDLGTVVEAVNRFNSRQA